MADTSLVAKQLRKSRTRVKEIGKFKFTIRRPTDMEMLSLTRSGNAENHDIARDYVCDWEGVTPADIVPSGGSDLLPFDAELWREWLADRPDFWLPIATAVVDEYTKHRQKMEETEKN